MKVKRVKLVVLNVILLVMLVVSVNGSVLNEYVYQALIVSCETPKVILQSGTAGSSTIYMNSTSAKVSVVSSDWWDSRWRYRRPLSINNTQNTNSLSNYSVFINVTYYDGMKMNFSDLRFTWYNATSNVEAEVPYWVEKKVNSTYAETWIEVPEILNSTYYSETNTTMNMYYGNPDASSVSNTDATFAFFADFENSLDGDDGSSEGFTPSSVAWVVESKEYSGDDSWEETYAGENSNDYVLRGKINIKSVGFAGWYGGGFMFRYIDWANYYIVQITPNSDWVNLAKVVSGVWTDITGTDHVIDLNTDYIVTTKVLGSSIKVYIDGNLVINTSDSALSNGKIALYVEEAHVHFDDIRVRKYTEPEPTIGIGSEETNIVDYVDNNTSEMGPPSDKGTHSNFSAQQAGPDSVFDTLTEEKTAFESGYRVQQGDFLFQGTDTYIPLDYEVNTTNAFVIMPNLMWQENVTAATSGDPGMNDDNAFVTAYLYNSTHIRVQRWTSSDGDLRIGWQVLECFADELAVQRGEKYLSSFTSQNASDTIPNPVDPAKSMAWHHWRTSYITRDGRVSQFYSNVTNSTTITFRRQGNQSVTGYLRWIVVEWDTSKIDNFAQGYVTGYGTDTSPFTDSIGTTVNESQSILIFQTHAIGDDGLDTSTTAGYFMNNTHVAFYNYDSSFSRGIKWYVIDFGSGVGSRQDNDHTAWSSTDYVNDDALDPSVQLNRALVWLSGSSNGDGTLKPRHTQWWILNPINSTHSNSLHYERRYGGQNREIAWQVLELPYSSANHELDLEVQWTNVNYTETYEALCIKTGTMDAEGIKVDVWNGSTWITILTDLTPNSWNNASVSLYLDSSTFTIRFRGGSETEDATEDSWNIDTTLLHVLTSEPATYDHVLQTVNQVTDLWKVRLRAYDQTNIRRLSNCTIYFHNSTDGISSQINIENGAYKQDVGAWYNLTSFSIIYISLAVVTKTQGTSYIYIYLEILIPDTSTYSLYVITFEIT